MKYIKYPEIMSIEGYERDDRSESFRMIGDIIATLADTCGITIDDVTRARWRDTMGLLREFDTLVDDQGLSYEESISELTSFDRFRDNYPALCYPEMPEETHLKMVKRVAIILEHSKAISQTDDVDNFIFHRKEEVYHSAELLADCATGDTTTQPGFYTKFMQVLRTMGEAANFIDTITDFRQDKKEKKIIIKPTKEFCLNIGRIALNDFVKVIPIIVRPAVAKQFVSMSAMRLQNRRRYGKRPYSSIKNLT